ncbi:MAG TPA: phosphatidate cytidylyltransferase [Actinomycetota bacterium]|nr:phosphatidate cytidylyltransferase [Actinomycetota bacterium]
MAEDEGREDREDLFEDLDKFFAPIQDVDWPESVEPSATSEAQAPAPEEHAPTAEREGPAAEEPKAEEPKAEALFAEPPAPEEPASSGGEDLEEEGESAVEAFLFAEEDEEEDVGAAIASERERPPDAYVDLPGGPSGEDTEAVAEPIEEPEEAPSSADLEAAAEHFAASVREDVPPESGATTEEYETRPEAGIEELLAPTAAEGGTPDGPEPETPVRTVRVGAEGLGGPSWQEPTAVEVGPDVERRAPGRNVQIAFLTGVVLAILAVGAIAIGPAPFAVLAGAVVVIAQGEFYFALQKRHYQPATALGLVTGVLVLAAGYFQGEAAMLAITALGAMASFLWYMTVPAAHRRNVISNVALTVLGIAWIPLFAGYVMTTLWLDEGSSLVVAILGLTVAYDASAFAVGYLWGSRPLAPTVSPKKSWEGALGASLVVVALAVGLVTQIDLLELPRAVGLALVVSVFAPLGDLAESLVKRDLGIKDMGSILPGHGGILDRIDGMLFVLPAAFLYLRLLLA